MTPAVLVITHRHRALAAPVTAIVGAIVDVPAVHAGPVGDLDDARVRGFGRLRVVVVVVVVVVRGGGAGGGGVGGGVGSGSGDIGGLGHVGSVL